MIPIPEKDISREDVIDWVNGVTSADDFMRVALDVLTLLPHRVDRDELAKLVSKLPHDVKVTLFVRLHHDISRVGKVAGVDFVIGHENRPEDKT